MVFSSLIFIFVFLPFTLLIYYISPKFLKNFILLIASLIFYAWGEPVYVILMISTITIMYFCTMLIDKYRERVLVKNIFLIITLVISLGILIFFKYYGFIIENLNFIFHLQIRIKQLPLPVGISFYTFQTLSYVIDVYSEKVAVQRNFITFAMYVTMFPQLVAGPIVRYIDVVKEIDNRNENTYLFGQGVEIFIIGLSKKVLLANNIGLLWNEIKSIPIEELSILGAWIGIIAFTFQIYFDFSGYSDMAIGLGKMFGFNFMKNFNYPYISRSITEFWRRWHISLGIWFREYVYIPLGGNRDGVIRQCRNLIIVWMLTGIWHGANWNFVIWGLYFGIFIIIEKIFLLKKLEKLPSVIGHLYTMLVVVIGWVFFSIESLTNAIKFLGTMFGLGNHSIIDDNIIYLIYTNILLFIVLCFASTPIVRKVITNIKEKTIIKGDIFLLLVFMMAIFLSTACLVNESFNPFLYFKF
ncbi:MBOAT family protein [Clostridium sediminicola]|uniref:MBOAT family O-acyltransferase n=1 Tax=Clostridium sediminicola TaxID=3114879 RepID=UPI0031F2258C